MAVLHRFYCISIIPEFMLMAMHFSSFGLCVYLFPYTRSCSMKEFWLKLLKWASGRMLELRLRGCRFVPYHRHCIVYMSKTLYSLLSTGSTQEDLSDMTIYKKAITCLHFTHIIF